MFSNIYLLFTSLLWLIALTMIGGCAEYGFKTSANPISEKILQKSIQKEFDLLIRDFDSKDSKGDTELCAPVRFAVARFAVYQALEEKKNAGMAQMTRFILRARRALTSAQSQFKSRKCVDNDGDGLTDIDEVRRHKTNPNRADTDSDGLSDGQEIRRYRTNPLHFDTDNDLLSDGEEVLYLKLNPKHPDSDRDENVDSFEVSRGTDPLKQSPPLLQSPPLPSLQKMCRRSPDWKKSRCRGVRERISGRAPPSFLNGRKSEKNLTH